MPRRWRQVGWALAVSAGLWSGALLWVAVTRYEVFGYLLLFYGLIPLGVAWLIWAAIGLFGYHTWRQLPVAPALVLLAAILVATGAASATGWWLTRPALEDAAAQCLSTTDDRRIGVYTISRVESVTEGCLFTVPGMGFLDEVGFAYLPMGTPPLVRGGTEYAHLDGPWYRFVTRM